MFNVRHREILALIQVRQTWAQFAGSAEVDTFEKSMLLAKKFIIASFSNILFVRNCFDEQDYVKKVLNGERRVPLRILSSKSTNPEAKKFANQLSGALDALEKKYLRKIKMVICLDPEQPDQAHEIYTIKVSYPEGMVGVIGLSEVKKSTTSLLYNTLLMTEGLDPLPETAYLGLILDYNEDTPDDYEPPSFENYSRDLVPPEGTRTVRVGKASTNFHSLELKVSARPGVNQSPGHDYQQQETSQGSQSHVIP